MKKITLIFTFIFANLLLINAQSSPDGYIEKFFETFQKKGSTPALDELYSSNKWVSKAEDAVANLKSQMVELTVDYVGELHGYELITKKKLSDSYILYSYLVKYDRQPIRFTFQFYKPNKTWRLQSFKFDASLDDELEEAVMINNLKE